MKIKLVTAVLFLSVLCGCVSVPPKSTVQWSEGVPIGNDLSAIGGQIVNE